MWVCECVFLARHQITFVCKSAAFLQTFFCAAATRQPTVAIRGKEREMVEKGRRQTVDRHQIYLNDMQIKLTSTSVSFSFRLLLFFPPSLLRCTSRKKAEKLH